MIVRLLAVACVSVAVAALGCNGVSASLNQIDPEAYASLKTRSWLEVRDGRLTIYTNAPERVARELVDDLSLLRAVLARVTNFRNVETPPEARIIVFSSYLGYRFFQGSPTIAAYYRQSLRGQTLVTHAGLRESVDLPGRPGWVRYASASDPLPLLFHEYVHLLLRNSRALIYPPWYDEGMAEMLSTVRRVEDVVEVGRIPERDDPAPMAMVHLLSTRNYWVLSEEQRQSFYARSWGLVHMLAAGHILGFPDRRQAVQRYMVLLNRGLSVVEACHEALGVGPAGLGGQLVEYLESGRIPLLRLPANEFSTKGPDSVRRLPEDEAFRVLTELAVESFGLGSIHAQSLIEAAVAVNPNDATALAWMARSTAAAGLGDEAASYEARSDASGGGHTVDLILAEGWLAQAAGTEEPEERGKLVDRARERLLARLAEEPGALGAHVLLGRSYLLTDDDPRRGIESLEYARESMRSDTSIHLSLAELQLRAGDRRGARKNLDVVLQWSGIAGELEWARMLSEQLDVAAAEGAL